MHELTRWEWFGLTIALVVALFWMLYRLTGSLEPHDHPPADYGGGD